MPDIKSSAYAMAKKIAKLTKSDIDGELEIKSLENGEEIIQLSQVFKDLIEHYSCERFHPTIISQEEEKGIWIIRVSECRSEIYQLLGILAETSDALEKIASLKKLQRSLNSELQKIKDLGNETISISSEYIKRGRVYKVTLCIDGKPPTVIQESDINVLLFLVKNGLEAIVKLEVKALRKSKHSN